MTTERRPPPAHAVRALLGRGSIYTIALAIQLGASIITVPIATRLLPASQYGVIALASTIAGVVTAISACGLPNVLGRVFFDGEAGPPASQRLILPSGLLALAGAAIAGATSPIWSAALDSGHHLLALNIAVASTVPAVITALCESYLRAAERAKTFVAVTMLAGVVGQFTGVALVAVARHGDATDYLIGMGGGYVLSAAVALAVIRPWRQGFADTALMRASLKIGLPLIPWGVAWLLLALGDRIVIQSVSGSASVGRYQVAYTVGALSLTLVSTVASAWTPIVFGAAEERRWAVHGDTLAAILRLTALVSAGLAIAGPEVLRVATPSSYREANLAPLVALIAVSALPWALYSSCNQIMLWHKDTKALAWITPVAAVVNLALVAALVPPLGLTGAGIATLVAYGLLAVLANRQASAHVAVAWLTRPVVIAWTVCLPLAVFGAAVPTGGVWLFSRIALSVAVLVGFGFSVRGLVRAPADLAVPPAPTAVLTRL